MNLIIKDFKKESQQEQHSNLKNVSGCNLKSKKYEEGRIDKIKIHRKIMTDKINIIDEERDMKDVNKKFSGIQ